MDASPPSGRSGRQTPQSTTVTLSPSARMYMLTLSIAFTPIGSATRVTPGIDSSRLGPRRRSSVHAFQQGEPDLELDLIGGRRLVDHTGDPLHLEEVMPSRDSRARSSASDDRVLDCLAAAGEIYRLLHAHDIMIGPVDRARRWTSTRSGPSGSPYGSGSSGTRHVPPSGNDRGISEAVHYVFDSPALGPTRSRRSPRPIRPTSGRAVGRSTAH